MKLTGWVLALGVLTLSLGGCSETICTAEITYEQNFSDITLEVGERAKATFKVMGCGGSIDLTRSVAWTSNNPNVATVERKTGEITGRSIGKTRVKVVAKYGSDNFVDEDQSYVDVRVVTP
jgi:hypothetical protein